MLTRVDVLSENPFYLNIRDARPTDSIIVDKIEGLDPPAVDLHMGEYVYDGGFYSGRRVTRRNVVITLTLNPNYANGESFAGLRELVYGAFLDPLPDSDEIALRLHDDEQPIRILTGHTEKIEQDIFSNDETIQISMLCANPYIFDEVPTALTSSGPAITVQNPGTAEVGFELEATLLQSTSKLYLVAGSRPPMILDYPFQLDDRITINTVPGQQAVTVLRSGVETQILYSMTAASKWPFLRKGSNVVRAHGVPTTGNPTPIVATIESINYRAAYWGI